MNSEKIELPEDLNVLSNIIKNKIKKQYKDVFLTFAAETSLGKTTTACRAIAETKNKTFVFVTKFSKEVKCVVDLINEIARFNKAIGYMTDKTLLGSDSNLTNNVYNLSVKEHKVLVITHSTYLNACNEEWQGRKVRTHILSRECLIIDEELNPVKYSMIEFYKTDYIRFYDILKGFDEEVAGHFKNVSRPLEFLFNKEEYKDSNYHRVIKEEFSDQLDYYISNAAISIKSINSLDDEVFEDYNSTHTLKATKGLLCEYVNNAVDIFKAIIDRQALIKVNSNKIYTYNYNFKYIMLDSNIWLDASSSFMSMYKSNLFKVCKTKRIIDHSNVKINIGKINTSSSAKNKYSTEFRNYVTDYVYETVIQGQEALILTKKIECTALKNKFNKMNEELAEDNEDNILDSILAEPINIFDESKNIGLEFLNFENMRGVNDCRDYKNVFSIHTYRLPEHYYVFLYEYFFRDFITDDEMKTTKFNKSWGFINNTELQTLMITDMASSLYQGIKRIDRCKNPTGTYHIFMKCDEVVELVLEQFNNLKDENIKEFGVDLNLEKAKKLTKKDIVIEWIMNRLWQNKGKWSRIACKDIINEIGMSRTEWNRISKDEEFVKFLKENKLKEGNVKGEKAKFLVRVRK